jgi:hypothetical protein
MIVDVTLAADGRFAGGRILGTAQVGEGIPMLDPANEGADVVRMLTAEDFPLSGVSVAQDGSLGAGR